MLPLIELLAGELYLVKELDTSAGATLSVTCSAQLVTVTSNSSCHRQQIRAATQHSCVCMPCPKACTLSLGVCGSAAATANQSTNKQKQTETKQSSGLSTDHSWNNCIFWTTADNSYRAGESVQASSGQRIYLFSSTHQPPHAGPEVSCSCDQTGTQQNTHVHTTAQNKLLPRQCGGSSKLFSSAARSYTCAAVLWYKNTETDHRTRVRGCVHTVRTLVAPQGALMRDRRLQVDADSIHTLSLIKQRLAAQPTYACGRRHRWWQLPGASPACLLNP